MKLNLAALLRDTWALWQRDHALLLPLAGLTIFVPRLALQLLVPQWPMPDPEVAGDAAMQAWSEAFAIWVGNYGGWFVAVLALGLWGTLSIVALYLDRGQPTVTGGMRRGLALLPRYLLAMLLVGLPAGGMFSVAMAAPMLLIFVMVPLLYVYARTTLIAAVLAAEAPTGAVASIVRSWRLTTGNGWQLAWVLAATMLGSSIFGSMFLALGKLAPGSMAATGVAAAAATAVEVAGTLAVALVAVVAYRRLASSGT